MEKIKNKRIMTADSMDKLPYRSKVVLELYAHEKQDVDRLERRGRILKKEGIYTEMHYTHQTEISYATLVIFLPWQCHAELSRYDAKTFKLWHTKNEKVRKVKSR